MEQELIKRIHQLNGATGLTDADYLVISQLIAGVHKTRKVPLEDFKNYLNLASGAVDILPNSGLVFEDGKLSTKFNTQIPDITDNVEVGGAGATGANYWKTQNLVEAFDKILFPDLLPTYTVPTLILSSSHSGFFEIGSLISQQLTLTATKNDAGNFSSLTILKNSTSLYTNNSLTSSTAIDVSDQFNLANPNNPNYKYIVNYTNNLIVPAGVTSWSGKGNYSNGLAKKNNKNITDSRIALAGNINAPQLGQNNFVSNEVNVTGYYPYFWGKISQENNINNAYIAAQIQAGNTTKVAAPALEDINIIFNANEEYIWVAVPSIYPDKTKWFNSAINNGAIASDQFIKYNGEYSVTTDNGLWSGVNYKIYVSSWPSITEGVLIFKN